MKYLFLRMTALLLVLLLSTACSEQGVPVTGTEPNESQTSSYEVVAEELRSPWDIAFAEETIYISEREGTIVKLEGDKMTRQEVQLNKPLNASGEGGFLGFVLTPQFSETKQAYAYHTYKESGEIFNRVVLLMESESGWSEMKTLIEGIPGASTHNGGRMAIGPDDKFYITTGDAGKESLAQEVSSLAGKILRLELDGGIPADNPFEGSYVYSLGHRNPQGLVWDAEGKLYITEHGPSGFPGGHDEINLITAGGNYGWPEIIGDEQKEGMTSPLYHTGDTAIAPSGTTITADGQMLIATLRGETLYAYDPAKHTLQVRLEGEGRLRDVKIHQGQVYVITNNTDGRGSPSETDDRLIRLR